MTLLFFVPPLVIDFEGTIIDNCLNTVKLSIIMVRYYYSVEQAQQAELTHNDYDIAMSTTMDGIMSVCIHRT